MRDKPLLVAGLTRFLPGEPTDEVVMVRGVKATKNIKAGENIHNLFRHHHTVGNQG